MGKKAKKAKKANKNEDNLYAVEEIKNCLVKKGINEYQVKWEGYGEDEMTWEPLNNLAGNDKFEEFVIAEHLKNVDAFEGGLTEKITQMDPEHAKEVLLDELANATNVEKKALMNVFNMRQERDSQLVLDKQEI